MTTRKIDAAWDALESQYHILQTVQANDVAILTAGQITALGAIKPDIKFEARLLTHFDNRQEQPEFFNKNDLSIFPTTRGTYAIGHFSPYASVPDIAGLPVKHVPPITLESAVTGLRFNESMGLNYALATGILKDFVGEELTGTVAGRHSGGKWGYSVKSGSTMIPLSVDNPQIEIDGGYEGAGSLVLVEAKNKTVGEFNLRQLYYPYRAWASRVKKPVRTVFAAISGDDFFLFEYEFPNPMIFEAKATKNRCHYIIDSETFHKAEIWKMITATSTLPEPQYPFPQANSPITTMDIISFIAANPGSTCDDIAAYIGFDPRQADYYCNSAAYFGFLERDKSAHGVFALTQLGAAWSSASKRTQKELFIKALLAKRVFRESIEWWLANDAAPDKIVVGGLMKKAGLNLGPSLQERRSSTVRKWVKWLSELCV